MMQQTELNRLEWNNLIASFPSAHILQSWEWGEFKEKNGWRVNRFVWKNENCVYAAAQILQRTQKVLKFRESPALIYLPRGPVMDWNDTDIFNEVLNDLRDYGKKQKAIFVKIDPEVIIKSDNIISKESEYYQNDIKELLIKQGWKFSSDQIQYRNTVWVDLIASDDDLLSSMKQKTRYNIRLAERKGVVVRNATVHDFSSLYDLYAQTCIRDGFIIRPKEYYFSLWQLLFDRGMANALIAGVEKTDVAGLFLFYFAKKAWYFYGMSSDLHREKMPNYLLQWEAMKLAKSLGCEVYDLWGAPNSLDEEDPMWGVYRFKEGLGGKFIQTIGAWDFPENKFQYSLYNHLIPKVLNFSRFFRKKGLKAETAG